MRRKIVVLMFRRRLGRLKRRLESRLFPGTLVLLYHRVGRLDHDPFGLAVDPEHFAAHLEILGRSRDIIPLSRLAGILREGRSPPRAAVITFDDGYRDNLTEALPLLERRAAPATVFVSPGPLCSGREFWWDELEGAVFHPAASPERLAGLLAMEGPALRHRYSTHRRGPQQDWGPSRDKLLRVLYQRLHCRSPLGRQQQLDRILSRLELTPSVRPSRRLLSPQDLCRLASSGLIEIGCHTMSHPVLPALTGQEQLDEICSSRQLLESILGQKIDTFSYPHGRFDSETVRTVRRAGLQAACCSNPGWVDRHTDRLRLPRWAVGNWDGPAFSRFLEKLRGG